MIIKKNNNFACKLILTTKKYFIKMLNYNKDVNLPHMTYDEFCEFERNFSEQWSAEWTFFTNSKPEDYEREELTNKQETKVHEA